MVRVATTRTTRLLSIRPTMFVRKSLGEATEHRQGCITPVKHVQKKEPRRGDRIQAGVKPLTSMRKKEKPRRGDGTAAYPLSFCHSSGVLMGGCFHTGVTLSLTPACSPSLLRSYWIRFSYLKLAYETIFCIIHRVVRVVMTRITRFFVREYTL